MDCTVYALYARDIILLRKMTKDLLANTPVCDPFQGELSLYKPHPDGQVCFDRSQPIYKYNHKGEQTNQILFSPGDLGSFPAFQRVKWGANPPPLCYVPLSDFVPGNKSHARVSLSDAYDRLLSISNTEDLMPVCPWVLDALSEQDSEFGFQMPPPPWKGNFVVLFQGTYRRRPVGDSTRFDDYYGIMRYGTEFGFYFTLVTTGTSEYPYTSQTHSGSFPYALCIPKAFCIMDEKAEEEA
jgi:hypothetical protein